MQCGLISTEAEQKEQYLIDSDVMYLVSGILAI